MEFARETDTLTVNAHGLPALASQFGIEPGRLALHSGAAPSASDYEAAGRVLADLSADERRQIAQGLRCVLDPKRVLTIDYTLGARQYGRALVGLAEGAVAVLTESGNGLAIEMREPVDIRALVARTLAADETLRQAVIDIPLSAVQAIVMLAVAEQFRFGHYQSLLNHRPAWATFTLAELMERLAEAATADPRWPLMFLDKVLPGGVGSLSITEAEVKEALDYLTRVGLLVVHAPEEDEEGPIVYELAEDGELISEGLLHNASKVAVLVAEPSAADAGEPGYELFLLVREAYHLWLINVAGRQGYIAALDAEGFSKLMETII